MGFLLLDFMLEHPSAGLLDVEAMGDTDMVADTGAKVFCCCNFGDARALKV